MMLLLFFGSNRCQALVSDSDHAVAPRTAVMLRPISLTAADSSVLPRGQVAIHDHRHLAQYAKARLQRLQSRIDRLNGAVDGLAYVRDHKSLRGPLHRQSHPAMEKGLRLAVERGGLVEVAQQIEVDMLGAAL